MSCPTAGNKSYVDIVKCEQSNINTLFTNLKKQTDMAEKRYIGYQIIKELSQRLYADEELVFSIIKSKLAKGPEYHDRLQKDHTQLKVALDKIDTSDCEASKKECCQMWAQIFKLTDEHYKFFDSEILPGLQKSLTETELCDLGKKFVEQKCKMPTHPHPNIPFTGWSAVDKSLAAVDAQTDQSRFDKSKVPSKKMCVQC